MQKFLFLIGLLLWFSAETQIVRGQGVSSLRVSQAYVDLPVLTAYLDASTVRGEPTDSIRADQIAGSLGTRSLTVDRVSPFQEQREGVAHIFLVDVSKSLQPAQQRQIRSSLQRWVSAMNEADKAALVAFGTDVTVLQDFTSDVEQLQSRVRTLNADDESTQLHAGLARAIELGQRRDINLPKRRVIVVLSDGRDDIAGGMTAAEVEERMMIDRVPLYAIGYVTPPRTSRKEAALNQLGAFARMSGGTYVEANQASIDQQFATIRESIQSVHVAQFSCADCAADNTERRLQVQLTSGETVVADGLNVRMRTSTSVHQAEKQRVWYALPWWGYAGGTGALLLVAIGIYFFVRDEETSDIDGTMTDAGVSGQQNDGGVPPLDLASEAAANTSLPTSVDDNRNTPSTNGLQVHLDVIGDAPEKYKATLVDQIVIGRASDCDISIDDQEASKQNTKITREADNIFVRDLDSTNGTLVNGVPISGAYRLQSGDRILIGRTELRVTFSSETLTER